METAMVKAIDLTSQGHMLCKLRISLRGLLGERRDGKAGELVTTTYGTASDATKVSKTLIDSTAKTVRAVKASAQIVHNTIYWHTFPWGDSGQRFVPHAIRAEFTAKVNTAIAAFNNAVSDYADSYDALVKDAPTRLKELFDPSQYPSRAEMLSRFECKLSWFPVPNSGHFVSELLGSEAVAIRESFENELRHATNNATNDLIDRVESHVSKYVDKVANYAPGTDNSRAQSIFRDSLRDNMLELAGLVRKLNFLNDGSIDQLATQIERVARVSCEMLRENADLRKKTAEEGKGLLERLDSYRKTEDEIDSMIADVADYQ